jgi:hypothetical protein
MVGDGQKCVAPLFQPERVRQHGTRVNSAAANEVEVEVVSDRMPTAPAGGPVPIPDEVNTNFAGAYTYLRANPM